jgi:hypothetical protein
MLHLTAKRDPMEKARTIELRFLRQGGGWDCTTLEQCTLDDARALVYRALQGAGGLYTEADICIGSVYTERIPRPAVDGELVPLLGGLGVEPLCEERPEAATLDDAKAT